MAEGTADPKQVDFLPALDSSVRKDLRFKQALLAAANKCLEDERSYRFFDHLVSVSEMTSEEQDRVLGQLKHSEAYEEHELAAIQRLILGGGAVAFKQLVDMVRQIRVDNEIELMTR